MLPTIYKVKNLKDGNLFVMAKPVAGEWLEDEFVGLKMLGIDKVVSLLEISEQAELGLNNEKDLCIKNGIEFESFSIADRGLPNTELAIKITKSLYREVCSGKNIVVHCRAGIGRTGIMSAAILMQHGLSVVSALDLVSNARGVKVPDTQEQEDWLGYLQSCLAKN